MARMRIDLANTQRQHRHGQQLEGVLETGAVLDLGESRILCARFGVGGGFEGTQGSLD